MGRILERLSAIEALIQSEAQRCPWREVISRIQPNTERINELEKRVTELRIEMARMAAISGGVSGTVVSVVFGVGKAAGWW